MWRGCIIGCSGCICWCKVMGVGVSVGEGCGYILVFSELKSIENFRIESEKN